MVSRAGKRSLWSKSECGVRRQVRPPGIMYGSARCGGKSHSHWQSEGLRRTSSPFAIARPTTNSTHVGLLWSTLRTWLGPSIARWVWVELGAPRSVGNFISEADAHHSYNARCSYQQVVLHRNYRAENPSATSNHTGGTAIPSFSLRHCRKGNTHANVVGFDASVQIREACPINMQCRASVVNLCRSINYWQLAPSTTQHLLWLRSCRSFSMA